MKPILETVPQKLDQTLTSLGDYAAYPLLKQISTGEAKHREISPQLAMLLARLIELAEKGEMQ